MPLIHEFESGPEPVVGSTMPVGGGSVTPSTVLSGLGDPAGSVASSGVLVRTFGGDPALVDCVRITIGRPEDNSKLLEGVTGGTAR